LNLGKDLQIVYEQKIMNYLPRCYDIYKYFAAINAKGRPYFTYGFTIGTAKND